MLLRFEILYAFMLFLRSVCEKNNITLERMREILQDYYDRLSFFDATEIDNLLRSMEEVDENEVLEVVELLKYQVWGILVKESYVFN